MPGKREWSMNIVLHEPEIPHNTGAIGRTCCVTGSKLHLIRPLGFSVETRYLRRSGLDYWEELGVTYYDNFSDFLTKTGAENRMFLATTKGKNSYADVNFPEDAFLIFGRESAGLPESILKAYPDKTIRVPMLDEMRSLNLSVSAGIILYEALRQNNFKGLRVESSWGDSTK